MVNVQVVGLGRLGEHEDTSIVRREKMNHAKALEYRITRNLLRDRGLPRQQAVTRLAETVIRVLAAAAAIALLGAHVPELLWAGLAASVVYTLGLG